MTSLETARTYLLRDPVHFANPLEVLRRGSGTILYAGDDGVLVFDSESGSHMMSARTPACAERLLRLLPQGCGLLTGHETFYFLRASELLRLGEAQICYSALYERGDPILVPQGGFDLRPLEPAHAPYVLEHYSHSPGGLDYIRSAIGRGMTGAFVDGVPAGFVGTHKEGSIGLLEVLPAYRGRGLGLALEAAAVNRALERGQYPFGQVIEGNGASFALQRRAGLTLSRHRMFWLF